MKITKQFMCDGIGELVLTSRQDGNWYAILNDDLTAFGSSDLDAACRAGYRAGLVEGRRQAEWEAELKKRGRDGRAVRKGVPT